MLPVKRLLDKIKFEVKIKMVQGHLKVPCLFKSNLLANHIALSNTKSRTVREGMGK